MKKALLAITLSLLFFNVLAQEQFSDTTHRKIEFGLSIVLGNPGTFLIPAIGYGTDRHSVFIAPILLPQDIHYSFGLLSGYKFYPNRRSNRVNCYFSYNLLFFQRGSSSYFYPNQKTFHYSLENTIGYGFELRALNELYLTSEYGAGISNRWDNYSKFERRSLTFILTLGLKMRFRK